MGLPFTFACIIVCVFGERVKFNFLENYSFYFIMTHPKKETLRDS